MIENLLKKHQLRNTEIRRKILDMFLSSAHAISYSDIEQQLSPEFDRVSVYRTLKMFEEQRLIHRILNDSGGVNYAICRPETCHDHEHSQTANPHLHTHEHLHFKCEVCKHTFCLEEHNVPKIQLPAGYTLNNCQILVSGTCPKCG